MAAHLTRHDGSMTPYADDADLDALLAELDAQEDAEHPDVAVTDDSGWTLTAFPKGLLVWENVEQDTQARHLSDVARSEVRRLFGLLVEGRTHDVDALPWLPGYGG